MAKPKIDTWNDVTLLASQLAPASEWRGSLAHALLTVTGAKFAAVFTCAPSRPLDAEQSIAPPEFESLVNEVFNKYLPRVERGKDAASQSVARQMRVFDPLAHAHNQKLARAMRRELYDPVGIQGVVMAALLSSSQDLIGWLIVASTQPSTEFLEQHGPSMGEVADVASKTLQTALDLANAVGSGSNPDPNITKLSSREREIVSLLGEGLSDYQIATQLDISEQTVGTHLKRIYEKLQVHSRVELVARSGKLRLTSRPN